MATGTFTHDQEHFGLVNKYKIADEPEKRCLTQKFRRVRRRPGVEQFGTLGDGTATPPPRMVKPISGAAFNGFPFPAGNDSCTSLLAPFESDESRKRNQTLLEIRRV